jgi:hypothetical protein
VACAIVANFATLLVSRALIGLSVGLNVLHGVLIGKLGSKKAIIDNIVVISGLMFSFGAVWSAVLGYLLLEEMGWRTFILVTSLPVFIPPIVILHCYLEEGTNSGPEEEREEIMKKETQATVPNYAARIAKLSLFNVIYSFLGWMTILLVPNLIQMFKIKEVGPNSDCSVTATHGVDFLLLALVSFAALPGRILIHYVRKKISFRKRQVVVALLNLGCFVGLLLQENLAVVVTFNFVLKLLYGATSNDNAYIVYGDESYFGTDGFALGSGIVKATGKVGAVIGLALVAFTPPFYVMISASVVSALQIPVVFSMTEVRT